MENLHFLLYNYIKGGTLMLIFERLLHILRDKKRLLFFYKNKHKKLQASKKLCLLQTLIETNPNPIFYKDEKGIFQYCNTALTEYLGFKKEEIIGYTINDIFTKKAAKVYNKANKELINSKGRHSFVVKMKHNDGQLHDVLITEAVTLNKAGEISGITGNMTDITGRIISEDKNNRMLKLQEAMLDINRIIIKENNIDVLLNLVLEKVTSAMGNADIGCVMVLDEEENLKIVASKGYDYDEAKKFKIKLSQAFYMKKNHGKVGNTIIINNIQSLDLSEHNHVLESTEKAKLECSISTPILLDGKLYGFINVESTYNDAFDEADIEVMDYLKNQIEIGISKNKLYEETIYLSRFDKLTNVYNRRYFEELFEHCLVEARESNGRLLVVVFDLNGLKIINDTYGHLAGDELIKNFAFRLKTIMEPKDIVGRIGGDEFSAVFFNIDCQSLIKKFNALIMEFQDNPILFEEHSIFCSFSYGIAEFSEECNSFNKLIKTADKKMYEYKQNLNSPNIRKYNGVDTFCCG